MDAYLSADEQLSLAQRAADQAAGELERVSPRLAREVFELREWAAAVRRRVAREAADARQAVAA